MKSVSLDGLSLHLQDNSSLNLNSCEPFSSEAPQETFNLSGDNVETVQQNKEDSSISSQGKTHTFDSPQAEIEVVNLSSYGSNPNPVSTEQPPKPHIPTNSRAGNHQDDPLAPFYAGRARD